MIVVVARYRAAEGAADAVSAALREYAPLTRAEAGCAMFVAHQSRTDPTEFILYEQYYDQAAFDAHCASEHYAAIARDRIRPLLQHRDVGFFEMLEPGNESVGADR